MDDFPIVSVVGLGIIIYLCIISPKTDKPPPCNPTQSKILQQQADIKFLQDEIKQESKQ